MVKKIYYLILESREMKERYLKRIIKKANTSNGGRNSTKWKL